MFFGVSHTDHAFTIEYGKHKCKHVLACIYSVLYDSNRTTSHYMDGGNTT
jgi:hypothetical protein